MLKSATGSLRGAVYGDKGKEAAELPTVQRCGAKSDRFGKAAEGRIRQGGAVRGTGKQG